MPYTPTLEPLCACKGREFAAAAGNHGETLALGMAEVTRHQGLYAGFEFAKQEGGELVASVCKSLLVDAGVMTDQESIKRHVATNLGRLLAARKLILRMCDFAYLHARGMRVRS